MTEPSEEDGWAQMKEVNHSISQGSFAAAIPILERVLLTAGDTTKLQGAAHSGFAAAYGSMGQFDKALGHSKQQLAIAVELGDATFRAAALGNLGHAFHSLGQPAEGNQFIHEALEIYRTEGDHDGECIQHANLGVTLTALGQRDLALEEHRKEFALAERHNLTDRIIGAHGRVGSAYKKLGALDKATEYFEKQMQLAHAASDGLNERKARVSLAGAPDPEHTCTRTQTDTVI